MIIEGMIFVGYMLMFGMVILFTLQIKAFTKIMIERITEKLKKDIDETLDNKRLVLNVEKSKKEKVADKLEAIKKLDQDISTYFKKLSEEEQKISSWFYKRVRALNYEEYKGLEKEL